MELLIILCFSFMVAPSISLPDQQAAGAAVHLVVRSESKLPRKLAAVPVEQFAVMKNHKYDISGRDEARGKLDQVDDKKLRAHSGESHVGGDRNIDTWKLVGMDYRWVRRRRPIHNKGMPGAP